MHESTIGLDSPLNDFIVVLQVDDNHFRGDFLIYFLTDTDEVIRLKRAGIEANGGGFNARTCQVGNLFKLDRKRRHVDVLSGHERPECSSTESWGLNKAKSGVRSQRDGRQW